MSIISAGTSNTTTLVYTGDTTGNLVFQSNGTTEAMRITTAQNVGIGTGSPNGRLDVRTASTQSATVARFSRSDALVSSDIYYDGSDGCMSFGTTTNHPIAFDTNNTERMRIDSSGNVGIGTNSVTASWRFEVKGSLPAFFNNDSTANSPTYGGVVTYRPTNTTNNGVGFGFQLNDSSSTSVEYAYIGGLIETNTAGSQNGAIIFAPTASSNRTERMRLNSNGNLVLSGGTTNANGVGITFPATQSASSNANCLDDYEEGTWTPNDASGAGLSFTVYSATYTKIGRLVFVNFYINYPTTSEGSTAQIGNFPFTALTGGQYSYLVGRVQNNLGNMLVWQVNANTNYAQANKGWDSGSLFTNANLSGAYILTSGCYIASA